VYWQLVEMAIGAMSPAAFEDLVFALVRREDDRAQQLGPPDAGRDTIIACGDGTELVWQAKHHTAGIDWGKCEESLNAALRERKPREVTFVFPVKMTAPKEQGLEDLRLRYPQVTICRPWTLPDLRAKLAEAHDVRGELIDRAIGVDELHVREVLERAAGRDEAFEAQTAAAPDRSRDGARPRRGARAGRGACAVRGPARWFRGVRGAGGGRPRPHAEGRQRDAPAGRPTRR